MMANIKTFPLTSRKSPAVPKGTDWRSWDGGSDTPLFGVMIPRGVYIIDHDTYKGGLSIEEINAAIGGEPLDWQGAELQRTINGGKHYAFRVPEWADLINDADIKGIVGLDARASGKGYIATGKGYEPLTPFGVLDTLENPEHLPELTPEALAFFAGGQSAQLEDDDLMGEIAAQPLDFTEEQVRHYMDKLTPEQAQDSNTWLSVMFGLYHQTNGSALGWELFDNFSRKAPDKYNKAENRKRWESVGRSRKANPTTFATVVALAGGRGEMAVNHGGFFDQLLIKASNIETREEYGQLKKQVQALSDIELGPDLRAMIASEIYVSFGKQAGISKTDIRNAIKTPKRKRKSARGDDSSGAMPEWLEDWAYIEKTCEFANVRLGYEIKQEAFNAKFSRMIDCVLAEKTAAHLALIQYGIPTYVDKLFWPGAGQVVEMDGKQYLNSYMPSGVEPADTISKEGQQAIDRLMAHVNMTLSDPRERLILLNWLCYVYQNPGKRINWALLLQGGYGTGKSYFSVLLQTLMGNLVTNIEPAAIAGRFTGWAHGSIVGVMEEIRISGTNKFELMDRLKPFITNDTIQIEEKGRDHRTVPNFTSYFMLTNDKGALPIHNGDRRICVMFGRIQTEQQLYRELGGEMGASDYFDRLFADLCQYGPEIARFFLDRQICKDFRPQGRSPDTAAKRVMLSVAESPEQMNLVDLIEKHCTQIISDDILDVTWLRKLSEGDGDQLPHQRTLHAILLDLGYEPVEGKSVKVNKTRMSHYVWIDPTKTDSDTAKVLVKSFHDDPNHVPF